MDLKRVDFETAKKLKKFGFKGKVNKLYFNGELSKDYEDLETNWNKVSEYHISAPTVYEVRNWFLKKYNTLIHSLPIYRKSNLTAFYTTIDAVVIGIEASDTAEDAIEYGINYLIDYKNKSK